MGECLHSSFSASNSQFLILLNVLYQMMLCNAHRLPAVLYCEPCAEFLCEQCENAGTHAAHRTCSMQRAVRLLHDEGDACARMLRELCRQAAQSRSGTATRSGPEAFVPDAVEEGMLALFAEVERKLASLKEECISKYWAEKEKMLAAKWGEQRRANLLEMERALHQLQSCLGDNTSDAKKLRDECIAARALIRRIEAPPAASRQRGRLQSASEAGEGPVGERAGSVGDEARCDELASEFLHELQSALLPAMVYPWLVAAPGDCTPLGLLCCHRLLIPSFSSSRPFRFHICSEFPTFLNCHPK